MLRITVTPEIMKSRMEAMNRDYFTLEACEAIITLFEETGTDAEFDAIAIACEFTEETPEYIGDLYGYTNSDGLTLEEIKNNSDYDYQEEMKSFMNYLNDNTWAVLLDNGNIVYQEF